MNVRRKGYRIEWKIANIFRRAGWVVVRAGASLGDADLVCIRSGKCIFVQIKSTIHQVLYYYGYMDEMLQGFPFYLVVDFGYGNIRIIEPIKKVGISDGMTLREFLKKE